MKVSVRYRQMIAHDDSTEQSNGRVATNAQTSGGGEQGVQGSHFGAGSSQRDGEAGRQVRAADLDELAMALAELLQDEPWSAVMAAGRQLSDRIEGVWNQRRADKIPPRPGPDEQPKAKARTKKPRLPE